ncbi:MAG: nicotinamide-nucleotide amidohydrolase family protein [Oscillospiraceae bacterium]|nr:nicotinamide-nucleotide amidohydrolase family protein [Oscillospiraceae bacterium]
MTFSAAESCTGGLIAKRITDLPGASAVFRGGVVSYTDGVKAAVLGVPRELLACHGAVSAPVAAAMADGVRRLTGSDLAVSVTGVAGPDSDDRGNPVGLVYLALSAPDGTRTVRHLFSGDRTAIRESAAQAAFSLLAAYLNEQED